MDLKKQFGEKVKAIRKSKKMSQEQLALEAGIDRTYLPSIERGQRNVSLEVIAKLAKALNVPITDFFT
jgi:transcriptional regulator with XRE-family HTH domain